MFFKLEPHEIRQILKWYESHKDQATEEDKELVNQLKTFLGEEIEEDEEDGAVQYGLDD